MKYSWLGPAVPAFVVLGSSVHQAGAQVPVPTPGPVSSETRQKLRSAILDLARSKDPGIENVNPGLALPLAKLGDWQGALQLLRADLNAPRHSDQLWHWRACQLAQAGKWRAVLPAAAHIKTPGVRADAYLFAARAAVDSNVAVNTPAAASRDLKDLLLAAGSVLKRAGSVEQRAYSGYLWARAGDDAAAERVFARALAEAKQSDARERAAAAKPSKNGFRHFARTDTERDVLLLQARAGLLLSALRHADGADDFLMGWWIAGARSQAELDGLYGLVQKLPVARRISSLYSLSAKNSARGDKVRAKALFEEAHGLANTEDPPTVPASGKVGLRSLALNTMSAFVAARFLGDEELLREAREEVSKAISQSPNGGWGGRAADLPAMEAFIDLRLRAEMGAAPLTDAQLDSIAESLCALPPSDLQFRALELVATHYFVRKQASKLLPVTQVMQQTADKLAVEEAAERAKKVSTFNPYWPRSPRQITAIFWLQRAGDTGSAARFAQSFARQVPQSERPFAAMTLMQLGFSALADSLFDPKRESPRIAATARERWKKHQKWDWSAFMDWSTFAATEARFRSPEAPLRWIGALESEDARAQCLTACVSAILPNPVRPLPYVAVTTEGSSSSF